MYKISIFIKNRRRSFVEFTTEDISKFLEIYNDLNDSKLDFLILGTVIFKKENVEYITLTEIHQKGQTNKK